MAQMVMRMTVMKVATGDSTKSLPCRYAAYDAPSAVAMMVMAAVTGAKIHKLDLRHFASSRCPSTIVIFAMMVLADARSRPVFERHDDPRNQVQQNPRATCQYQDDPQQTDKGRIQVEVGAKSGADAGDLPVFLNSYETLELLLFGHVLLLNAAILAMIVTRRTSSAAHAVVLVSSVIAETGTGNVVL